MQTNPSVFEISACAEGFTLRERKSGQEMHSQVGAWTEANTVFIDQSDLEARRSSIESLVVYDLGMGIAANSLALIKRYRDLKIERPLRIVSFEKYPEAVLLAVDQPEKFPFIAPHAQSIRELVATQATEITSQIQWRLVTGDFLRADLSKLPEPELIYFDFYSPSQCPELWSRTVFKRLFEKSVKSKLITYSASKAVRSALLLAGFYVGKGASTELKKETTLAASVSFDAPNLLDQNWLKSLERSTKPFPLDVPKYEYSSAFRSIKSHPQFQMPFREAAEADPLLES